MSFLTRGSASLTDGALMPAGIAAGVDPHAFADSGVRWDFHGTGWVQVAAADSADDAIGSHADAAAVVYWEPVESQPSEATYETAYWFDSASFGDFFL